MNIQTTKIIHNRATLLNLMGHGAYLITPNNRLSNQLLYEFIAVHGPIQKKPNCLPYTTFLRDQFKQIIHKHPHEKHPILLNQNQERVLWELTLSHHNETTAPSDRFLSEVQDAWNACQLWNIDIQSPLFLQTPQLQQFQKWSKAFNLALKNHHAITESQIAQYLNDKAAVSPPTEYIWVTFDEFSPQQLSLQKHLETSGHQNLYYSLEMKSTHATCYAASHGKDELSQLVQWLKLKLNASNMKIGVIVPDLEQQSKTLLRQLNQVIPPDQFDISLGQPLLDFPIIEHAMQWLSLTTKALTRHQIMLLLNSPYVGSSHSELLVRAKILDENKTLLEAKLPFSHFINILKSSAPKLYNILTNITEYPEKATPAEWAALFKMRLKSIEFPGEYTLHSENYQYLQRFILLFDDFEQLALISPSMSKQFALTCLKKLAKTTIFQIKKEKAPIQILGLLEAAGSEFDCIWVTGLTDQCLPQKTKLSPFIPLSIQRENRMPRASSEKELLLAKQCIDRLQNGSHECVFSYPQLTEDSPNLPSPLIQHLPSYQAIESISEKNTISLNSYEENYLHPIHKDEVLTGGTNILAEQAKCPFRAFAIHRLKAKPLLNKISGLDAAERGQILHKILELIWKEIPSQKELVLLSASELTTLIHSAIEQVIAPMQDIHPYSFSEVIQEVEFQRLQLLLTAVMDWEKQRPSFAIKALEQAHSIELAGIPIQVRVDRIDTIANQETWIIDYKSSLPPHKPWNEDRPEAPQLLLYALLDPSIKAILFLQLKSGKIVCCGTSQDDYNLDGLAPIKKDRSWDERRADWNNNLTNLASEFKEGQCVPRPQRNSTCLNCDYQSLCRLA